MITSTSNAKIKRLVNLKKKKKLRDSEKVFLVEGIRMFREVPEDMLLEIYTTQAFMEKEGRLVKQRAEDSGIVAELLADSVFGYVSDTKTPQGILCVVRQTESYIEEISGADNALLLVLDNIQDPGNLGTIIRTAEGAGITGIIMSDDCVDVYNPKTIRSTMGSVYRMPFLYVHDLPEIILALQAKGVCIFAAHLEGSSAYDEADYCRKCAFLIGNEGNGLRAEVAACADQYIKIPMCGQVESLNAAVAASVVMFEAARQRRQIKRV